MTGPGAIDGAAHRSRLADPRFVRWVSSAIFVVIGAVWSLSSPLMSVPDEPAHTIRAVSIAHGQLRGDDALTDPNGFLTRVSNQVTVGKGYAGYDDLPKCHQFMSEAPAACAPEPSDDTTPTVTTTAAGAYPPLYYALVGWPSRLLGTAAATYAMRLIGAVLCGVLLGWGVGAAASVGRSRFAVVGAALAATPMVFFMAGSVNPNGLEIAAAFACWLLLIELLGGSGAPDRGLLVRLTTAAALLTLARPLGPAFTIGVFATMAAGLATRARLRELLRDRRVWVAAGVLAVLGLFAVAWTVKAGAVDSLSAAPHGPVNGRMDALTSSLVQTEYRARQMVGYFGWLDSAPPFLLEWGWFTAVGALGAWALIVGRWRQRLLLLAVLAGTVALPVVFEVQSAAKLGYFWQGRYSLPVGVGVPIVAGWIVASRTRRTRGHITLAALYGAGIAAGGMAGWATMMTRYDAGSSHPLTAFLHRGNAWHAPLSNPVLTALLALALLALAGLVTVVVTANVADEADPGTAADDRTSVAAAVGDGT